MKAYQNTVGKIKFVYFYDTNIRSWTVYRVDEKNYQVGDAEHYPNKKELLKCYNFNFKCEFQ
jgi:hypothetical protein